MTNLLGFKNGIYNLDTDEFVHHLNDTSCVKKLNHNFLTTVDSSLKEKLEKIIKEIFPDADQYGAFMDFASDIFTPNKNMFYVWVGNGNNGKSTMKTFFDLMLGKLSVSLPISCLTGKKPASCDSDLTKINENTLSMWFDDYDEQAINIDRVKTLMHNDPLVTRELYESKQRVIPRCSPTLVCNSCPQDVLKKLGKHATVIEFQSTFVDIHNTLTAFYGKEFPKNMNPFLELPELVETFILMILNYRSGRQHSQYNDADVLQKLKV